MMLRNKIKRPKAFTGEILDDVSLSIVGDRTLDSSELEEMSSVVPTVPPAPMRSISSRKPPAGELKLISSSFKKAPRAVVRVAKKPVVTKSPSAGRESRFSVTKPTTPSKKLEPAGGMTRANNTNSLGLRTQLVRDDRPAAFPTLDTPELIEAWNLGKAPYDKPPYNNIPKSPTRQTHHGDDQVEMDSQSEDESFPVSLALGWTRSSDGRTTTEIWDGLSTYWRLEILDSIASASDPPQDAYWIFNRLRLTATQIGECERMLTFRTNLKKREDQMIEESVIKASDLLKRKKAVSEEQFTGFLAETVDKGFIPDDELLTNPTDRQDAITMLSKLGLEPELLN